MTQSPLQCCTSIIRSSALVQASSSLSLSRTCALPRRLPVTEMHFRHFPREFQYMCIFFAVSHGVACILEQVFWALVHMQTYTLNRCLLDIKVHVCDTLAAGCAYVYVHIYIYAHAYIHGYVCASMILLEVLRRRCCTLRVPNKTTTLLLYTQ